MLLPRKYSCLAALELTFSGADKVLRLFGTLVLTRLATRRGLSFLFVIVVASGQLNDRLM